MDAVMSLSKRDSEQVQYQSRRTHRGEPPADYDAMCGAEGAIREADSGSLEHWLTAQCCLYNVIRKGRVLVVSDNRYNIERISAQSRQN